jgi:hypothetical protein
MTGLCAAIACARQGIKTALVHDRPVYGGSASSEIRMHICGASTNMTKENLEETGILYEVMLDNKFQNDYYNYSLWDAVLWNAVRREKNLTGFLNTAMYDVETEAQRVKRIYCYQSTTETHWELEGNIFIDCSGNGTLAYLAGAGFRTGSEGKAEFGEPHAPDKPNQNRMGNTLLFKAIDRGKPVVFKTPEWARRFTEDELKHRKHGDAQPIWGIPEYQNGTVLLDKSAPANGKAFDAYCLDYGYWWIELTGDEKQDIIDQYETIRDDLAACVYGIWDHLKNGGDHGAENYDLLWVGMYPGVRESRRVEGDYLLNENDLIENRDFPDAVAYGGWPIDNHTPNGLFDFDELPSFLYPLVGSYTIPYRCYYAKDVENLFIAGRILSATKLAMASTRVMGTCSVGGQAAGTAAALCIKRGLSPRALGAHIGELQQELLKNDCYIPGFTNQDENDLARRAKITASSYLSGREPENVVNGITRPVGKDRNYWESDGIAGGGETLTLDLTVPSEVSQVRLTFDTNLSRPVKITMSSKRMKQQQIGPPAELVSDYRVRLLREGNTAAVKEIKNNYQRLNVLDFERTLCDCIEVKFFSTQGIPNIRVFEIRVYQ